jgi:hypothetical protein
MSGGVSSRTFYLSTWIHICHIQNLPPSASIDIWVGLSLYTPESGGLTVHIETHACIRLPNIFKTSPTLELNDEIVVDRFYMIHRGPSHPDKQLAELYNISLDVFPFHFHCVWPLHYACPAHGGGGLCGYIHHLICHQIHIHAN